MKNLGSRMRAKLLVGSYSLEVLLRLHSPSRHRRLHSLQPLRSPFACHPSTGKSSIPLGKYQVARAKAVPTFHQTDSNTEWPWRSCDVGQKSTRCFSRRSISCVFQDFPAAYWETGSTCSRMSRIFFRQCWLQLVQSMMCPPRQLVPSWRQTSHVM